jgi:serine/threonine-protein kinase
MGSSSVIGRFLVVAVLAASLLAALAPTAWAQRRGRPHRRPGRWDKGWYESGWYDPYWVRLRNAPKRWERQEDDSKNTYSHNRYAAIAYSPSTGNYGYSFNYGSRCGAEQAALGRCRGTDASVIAWTRNAWCVLALGDDAGEYGWAWSTSLSCAKSRALAECRKRTTNCYVAVSVFSGN